MNFPTPIPNNPAGFPSMAGINNTNP